MHTVWCSRLLNCRPVIFVSILGPFYESWSTDWKKSGGGERRNWGGDIREDSEGLGTSWIPKPHSGSLASRSNETVPLMLEKTGKSSHLRELPCKGERTPICLLLQHIHSVPLPLEPPHCALWGWLQKRQRNYKNLVIYVDKIQEISTGIDSECANQGRRSNFRSSCFCSVQSSWFYKYSTRGSEFKKWALAARSGSKVLSSWLARNWTHGGPY